MSKKENIFLQEVSEIVPKTQNKKTQYVSILVINKEDASQNEEFILEPDSEIYLLYSNGKIDAMTLYNLAFIQVGKKENTQTKTKPIIRKLNKNFLHY